MVRKLVRIMVRIGFPLSFCFRWKQSSATFKKKKKKKKKNLLLSETDKASSQPSHSDVCSVREMAPMHRKLQT